MLAKHKFIFCNLIHSCCYLFDLQYLLHSSACSTDLWLVAPGWGLRPRPGVAPAAWSAASRSSGAAGTCDPAPWRLHWCLARVDVPGRCWPFFYHVHVRPSAPGSGPHLHGYFNIKKMKKSMKWGCSSISESIWSSSSSMSKLQRITNAQESSVELYCGILCPLLVILLFLHVIYSHSFCEKGLNAAWSTGSCSQSSIYKSINQ